MITIIHAHPYANHSKAGRSLLASVRDLPETEIRELYEMYPDFHIDTKKEQEQLLKSDLIVLQTPLHWYHVPSLMSLWFEKVLAYGWAHGEKKALAGKKLLWAVTTGDRAESFSEEGVNRFHFQELTRPVQLMTMYCQMTWLEPFVVYNASQLSDEELFQAGERYRDRLVAERVV